MAPVSSHIGKTMIGMTKLGMIWAITLQLGIYLPMQHMKKISEFTGMERTALYRKLKSLNIQAEKK